MGREHVLCICGTMGNGYPLDGGAEACTPYELIEGLRWVADRTSAIALEVVRCIG